MKSYRHIQNEKGGMAALLSVIIFSVVIVISLSSIYVYLENRAKYHGRIRMSYHVADTMEAMVKVISQGYSLALANSENCPAGTSASMILVQQKLASGGNVSICIPRNNYENDSICVTNLALPVENNRVCTSITSYEHFETETKIANSNRLENWYLKLDQFYDTTIDQNTRRAHSIAWNFLETELRPPTYLGWLLPKKAYASDKYRVLEKAGLTHPDNQETQSVQTNYENTPGYSVQATTGGDNQSGGRKATVRIAKENCSGVTAATERSGCYQCASADDARPCFVLQIRSPYALNNNSCDTTPENCFRTSVRLIR